MNTVQFGTSLRGIEFAKRIMTILHTAKGFEKHVFQVQIMDGGEGNCIAEFKVKPEHLNRGGGLHGGYTATVIDMVTTYALMSKPSHPGVSVDLHVNYMKAAKEGDEIIVDARTVRSGKKLAFIECELRNKRDNSIIAKGNQTKYVDLDKPQPGDNIPLKK